MVGTGRPIVAIRPEFLIETPRLKVPVSSLKTYTCKFLIETKTAFSLRGWLVGNRLRSVEILAKSPAVRIEKFADTLRFRRAQDKPGVMMLGHAIHDLRIVVSRSIRSFLPRQRNDHASVPVSFFRQLVRFFPRSNFQARPFSPQINSRGSFNLVRDVRSADARGHFDKIKFAVLVRSQEFRVGHSASQPQRCDYFAV